MRFVRRLALTALGLFLALLALELVLQVAAVVVQAGVGREALAADREGDGGRTVLCVGDSFTFGFGVDDPAKAYPRRLEARLRAAEPEAGWRVVNGGWSGNASPQLLAALPDQLARHRPDRVCVLIGNNDLWRGGDAEGGFELRTAKLARLVWLWVTTGRGPSEHGGPESAAVEASAPRADGDAPPPFVGPWHAGDLGVTFAADGRFESGHGELTWAERGGALVLQWPGGQEAVLDWRLDGDALVLAGGPFPAPLRLARGLPLRHDVDRGQRALEAGDVAAARRLFTAALADPALVHDARVGLVRTAVAADDREQARAELASLRTEFDARVAAGAGGDTTALLRVGGAFVDAALAAGEVDTAIAVAADLAERDPGGRWRGLLVIHGLAVRDRAPIEATMARLAARTDLPAEQRAAAYSGLVDLRRESGDAAGALAALFAGHAVHGADDVVLHAIQAHPGLYDRAALDAALATLAAAGVPVERRSACAALWERAQDGDGATLAQLDANLRRIVATCREAGAVPLLLTYPMPRGQVTATTRAVAAELGVAVVDVRPAFDALLPEVGREALFILDGHPSARGYDLMAEVVARALLAD